MEFLYFSLLSLYLWSFSFVAIVRIVWVLTRRIDFNLRGVKNDVFELARTNTIKMLLLVVLGFVICWSSNSIYFMMYNLGYSVNWNSVFYKLTVVMAFLNCTVNPFIYLAKYQAFQSALNVIVVYVENLESKETGTSNQTMVPLLHVPLLYRRRT